MSDNIFDLAGDNKVDELDAYVKTNGKKVVNKQNKAYFTPLHYCARYDNDQFAAKLIEYGAELEKKDKNKETPLHIAARNRSKKMVILLVKNNANRNARNRNFKDPKTVASENNNIDIRDYLDDPKMEMKIVENIYDSNDTTGAGSSYDFGH